MRWAFVAAWVTLFGALGVGVAASLSVDADDLGSGGAVVSSCDRSVDVVLVADEGAADRIVAVEVRNISRTACFDDRVEVLVRGVDDELLARDVGLVRTTTVRVDLAEHVDAAAITGVDVVIADR
ncbi:MAG: hypothetical protein AAF962_09010 [Actinomycetota bacterium]